MTFSGRQERGVIPFTPLAKPLAECTVALVSTAGVARNDDLKAHSPLLRLSGAGNLDIGNNGIDWIQFYQEAKASVTTVNQLAIFANKVDSGVNTFVRLTSIDVQ